MPDTRPHLTFDSEGVCSACRNHELKEEIDWESREKELSEILDQHRRTDGDYEVIIPVSGGKDSTYQTWLITKKYKLRALCVTAAQCQCTEIGRMNIQNLRRLGVDQITMHPNPHVYKKLACIGFFEMGDFCLGCHHLIAASGPTASVLYNCPLIIWGENSMFEYGMSGGVAESTVMDYDWFIEHGTVHGEKIEDFIGQDGLTPSDLKPYMFPHESDLERVRTQGLFLGSFYKWNAKEQVRTIKKEWGFNTLPHRNIGTYLPYENLDGKYVSIHDFFMFLKFGFGRCTSHASIDIRFGRMTKEQGLKLVKKYDGEFKYIKEFCAFLNISEPQFWQTVEKFKNKELFK